MRTVTPEIQSAIEEGSSYKSLIWAKVYPSRIFFTSITEDFPVSGADSSGIPDNPMPQEVAVQPVVIPPTPQLFTFYNNGGGLYYAENGSSTANNLSLSIIGKPGVFGNRLFRISGGSVYRHVISWSPVSLGGPTSVATPDETPLHVHAVSETRCVVLTDGDGGIRVSVIDNTTIYKAVDRFMFPKFYDYTSGSPAAERSISNLAIFSGALQLDNKTFVYISNVDGSVQGAFWDEDTREWSDIFNAVPTNLQVSLCEFRISNAYQFGGAAYLCGQFRRTENIETDKIYSMILRSQDGKSFAIDRFCSVSELGYRFLSLVGNDAKLYLGNCNRVCYSDVVYTFNGDNTDGLVLEIPPTSINSLTTSERGVTIDLKAGDETLMFHNYIEEGNKAEIYLGYETTSGSQGDVFGTYILESPASTMRDGVRSLSLRLLNESAWKLQSHTSPFYTEFMGKSSVYDDMSEESGNLYVAPQITQTRTFFFVDFWQSEPLDDSDNGVTGIDIIEESGVNYYSAAGSHKLGVKTKDLKEVMSIDDYPEIKATSINAKIYGWCHPDGGAGNNDYVELCLQIIHADGTEENIYTNEDTRWPQTYPSSVAGEDPITVTVSGLTVGDKIKSIGVTFESSNSTWLYISRVEVLDGVQIPFSFDDPNTPWDFSTSGSGFEIPGVGRPYVMFTQKPYNAFNFTLAARFEHTVQGPISTYPTAVGLLGLAQDGNNLVLGRYNRSNNRIEIVKIRDGIEDVLAFGTPSSGSLGANVDLLFKHRNGHFEVYLKPVSNWELELEYDWTAADGWMFTSDTVSMKCGIYGYLSAPSFRITGINESSLESSSNIDGIAHLPMESIADFPSSGSVKIGDNIYNYTSKITAPTILRGPHQLRQSGEYKDPYGDGFGIECRDFNWTNSVNLLNGKLFAVSDGSVFLMESSTASLWQIFIKTGGERIYLYNRSRHYSSNELIASTHFSISMKTWVTGGLAGITKVSGESRRFNEGDLCQLHMNGSVICKWFYGAGGDDDITVEDLIEKISAHAGAKAEFPGDVYYASQALGAEFEVGISDYREGFDLRFGTPSAQDWFVYCDARDTSYENETGLIVELDCLGGNNYRFSLSTVGVGYLLEAIDFTAQDQSHNYRVLFHDNFVAVYMDGKWIHTFGVKEIEYPASNPVNLGYGFTATDVRLRDLSDWREAIYIDLETDAMSAIGSVIQERPIEVNPRYNGALAYWYNLVRDTVIQILSPREHTWTEETPRDGASDAIVYGSDEVKCLQYEPFHTAYGFSTKVMRYPNLKSGAIKAARVALEKAFEQRIRHRLTIRPDLRLEVGDILSVSYTAQPTETVMTMDVIVENISMNHREGNSGMIIEGREDL